MFNSSVVYKNSSCSISSPYPWSLSLLSSSLVALSLPSSSSLLTALTWSKHHLSFIFGYTWKVKERNNHLLHTNETSRVHVKCSKTEYKNAPKKNHPIPANTANTAKHLTKKKTVEDLFLYVPFWLRCVCGISLNQQKKRDFVRKMLHPLHDVLAFLCIRIDAHRRHLDHRPLPGKVLDNEREGKRCFAFFWCVLITFQLNAFFLASWLWLTRWNWPV